MFGGDSPPGYNNKSSDTEFGEETTWHMEQEPSSYDFSDVK